MGENKKRQKKSLMGIRLKNENTHKNYIVRGAVSGLVQFVVNYFLIKCCYTTYPK
jgi:hypothetical protein